MDKWKPGDPCDCGHCAWGRETVGSRATGGGVTCFIDPVTVEKNSNHFCRQWAATRGLHTDWVDNAKLHLERAARYKCLCKDAVTVMKYILSNTSIPFRDQRARITQWEADFARAMESDVDIVE